MILKNNVPRYLIIDFSKADKDFTASDENENENGPDAPENTVNAFADVEDW